MVFPRNTISSAPDAISEPMVSKLRLRSRSDIKDTESISGYFSDRTDVSLSDLKHYSVQKDYAKILLLIAFPLLTIVVLSCVTAIRTIQMVNIAEKTRNAIEINSLTSSLVARLQVERGLSTGLLGSSGNTSLEPQIKKLDNARNLTDGNLTLLKERSDFQFPEIVVGNETIRSLHELTEKIIGHRKGVDNRSVTPEDNVNFTHQLMLES
ncbi:hypothetical protein BSL78_05676 [Apostichopus japonicus]|uniref:Nitrate/nitrite sensing protein domain-containing protein n=1 Tax=Stichopus japonicus TaxID=307972 RepID=A0A2G8LB64_STIJA|nr:hypothetical protein BSL78_05676 [Apostichopus japonicus]